MTKTNKYLIAPSILSADFSQLGNEVRGVEAAGADWIHVDVMDGHFVPNLTIGPVVVSYLKPISRLPLDCHLMVSEPEKWIESFAQAGASVITVHVEATHHLDRLVTKIQDQGCKAGVSLNPATPVEAVREVLDRVDLVLVMSVNPGFGGQKFIKSTLKKVEELARIREKSGLKFLIEIDGGITSDNVREAADAGCDVFVAGSAIFSKPDRNLAMSTFRKALD